MSGDISRKLASGTIWMFLGIITVALLLYATEVRPDEPGARTAALAVEMK